VILQNLAIALGLGLLVGLQRESVAMPLGGLRTFPLVTLLGAVCALLAQPYGGWVVAAGLLAVAALLVVGNVLMMRAGETDPGLTSETALLMMFAIGAYLMTGNRAIAIAVGGGTAVLLQSKAAMRGVASRLSKEDITAIMRFALISLVILPILPNRTYGPYAVWNPFEIWLMVVLIVGISLGGYIVYKFVGERAGILLGGILGGLISSTATTVSYARRSREHEDAVKPAAVVVLIASTVVLIRIMVLIAIASPRFVPSASGPIAVVLIVMAVLAAITWWRSRDGASAMPEQGNPSELKPAIFFGALYAGVLLASAAVRENFGGGALYAVAAISGLTDVDAITLSTARLVSAGRLDPDRAWRLVIVANACNLAFKGGTVALLGSRRMAITVGSLFGIAIAASALVLLLWP
jgi:uncharacterized membrane protein (DUF4010 family)